MSDTAGSTMWVDLDGRRVAVADGETILDVTNREGIRVPTLCHDPRLDPAGACRTCLVEIDGWPRLAPACATVVCDGMVVTSLNDRIRRHRQALMALYLSDHPAEGCGQSCELHDMAREEGAPTGWPRMEPVRQGRPDDRNPYVQFIADRCILCARCTRYCEEVEAVSAITLAGRGSETTISTVDGKSLMDSSCELCGGCIDVCPTGAMTEKLPITAGLKPGSATRQVRSTCNYCGVGCQLDMQVDPDANAGRGKVVRVTSPEPGTTTNDGNLCVKGRFAYDFIDHPDRLTSPLLRAEDGSLREASWEEALHRAAQGLLGVQERHGSDALGFVSSSRCTMEENYLVQKLARVVFHTNNVHSCAAT